MDIIEVIKPKHKSDFHKVQRDIARDFGPWIIHMKQDVDKVFNPAKNKLFRNGEATRWVVYKNRQPVGRIAAFINKKEGWKNDQPTGGIGFYDSINDQSVADLLFDTAMSWLKGKGMEAMDGPINFGERNQFWGLLIESFERENTYGMNYNPSYYKDLFENYGFQKYYEQLCFRRDIAMAMQKNFLDKYNRIKNTPGISFETAKGKSIDQLATDFVEVYNDAWGGHSGFKQMKKATALKMFKAMKPILEPDIVIFIYKNGSPIAFFLNMPDLNYYFKRFNGNLNLLNKIRFILMKKFLTPDKMIGVIFGVKRDFQSKGVEGALICFGKENFDRTNYKDIIMTWIGDFNPKMIKVAENLGSDVYHRYATMRYLFDRSQPFKRHPIIGVQDKEDS